MNTSIDSLISVGLVATNLVILGGLMFVLFKLNKRLKLLTETVYYQTKKISVSEDHIKKQLMSHSDNVLEEIIQLSVITGRLENVAVKLRSSGKVPATATSASTAQVSRIKQAVQSRQLEQPVLSRFEEEPAKIPEQTAEAPMKLFKSIRPADSVEHPGMEKETERREDMKIKKLSSLLVGQSMRKLKSDRTPSGKVRINER